MIPIGNTLKKNTGIIITKGDTECEGIEYIEELNDIISRTENPPNELVKMCNFYSHNPNHVFSFPKPKKSDKDKLLEFLQKDLLINPKHHISISNEAKLKLKIIRDDHSQKLSNAIRNFCDKLISIHQNQNQKKLINGMILLSN